MNTHARTILAAALAASTLTLAACSGQGTVEPTAAAAEVTAADGTTIADTTQAPSAEQARDGNSQATVISEGDWSADDAQQIDLSGAEDLTITEAGVYRLSGTLDGGVIVAAGEEDQVVLILDNVTIANPDGPAIQVTSAEDVAISLVGDSKVSDAAAYPTDAEADAAIYSVADLTVSGSGSLTVEGKGADGIVSTDDLVVLSGTLTVTAADDGLRGKDSLTIEGGRITVDAAGGDALRSNHDADATKGWVEISGGTLDLTAGDDGIDAATDALLTGGDLNITSTDKGVVTGTYLLVEGAAITIEAADDGLHSDGAVGLHSGNLTVRAGDDGVHADVAVVADGANLTVAQSEEALEGGLITISAGSLDLTSADDGINASGYTDAAEAAQAAQEEAETESSAEAESAGNTGNVGKRMNGMRGAAPEMGAPMAPEAGQGAPRGMAQGAMPGGPGGMDQSSGEQLLITGGTVVVDAGGDGLDSNGDVVMTGGNVTVWGPTNGGNGALDYNGEFTITGGTLAAVGSAGMSEAPSSTEDQGWLQASASGTAGAEISILNDQGEVIATYEAPKDFGNVVFSSEDITMGQSYTVRVGETSTQVTAGESSGGMMGGMGGPGGMGQRGAGAAMPQMRS